MQAFERVKLILKNKLIVPILLLVVMNFTKNIAVTSSSLALMIIWIYLQEFKVVKTSIWVCFRFLLVDAFVLSLFLASIVGTKIVTNNEVLDIIVTMSSFILIYSIFYILVAIRSEKRIARLTILTIVTIITIIYMVVSTLINAYPLSHWNNIILMIDNGAETLEQLKEYDGRVIFNFILQIATYPLWLASLVGTLAIEVREYHNDKIIL